jgi:ABC-type multidrug transport system ATPase subunit
VEIIAAHNIVRTYSAGHGIRTISFSVQHGQCFGVLGANGSGKTTLTRLIAGLDRVRQGQLSLFGDSTFPRPRRLRRRCGVAVDTPAHWEHLTGRQNLAFFAHQYGLAGPALNERVDALLSDADLTAQADEPVETYSFGMRRKLNIIEAMVHDPDLLILDEPSAGVDMAFQDRLATWIWKRCDDGKTTWIADNDADWLAKAATEAVLLSQGRIVAGGSVKDLLESMDARYRIRMVLEKAIALNRPPLAGFTHFKHTDNELTADMDGDPHLPARLIEWVTDTGGQVRSMQIHAITLHEALQQRAGLKEPTV